MKTLLTTTLVIRLDGFFAYFNWLESKVRIMQCRGNLDGISALFD
jgi:hypothetical protein